MKIGRNSNSVLDFLRFDFIHLFLSRIHMAPTIAKSCAVSEFYLPWRKVKKMKKNIENGQNWMKFTHFSICFCKFWWFCIFSKMIFFDFIIVCKFIKFQNTMCEKIQKTWKCLFFSSKNVKNHWILLFFHFYLPLLNIFCIILVKLFSINTAIPLRKA